MGKQYGPLDIAAATERLIVEVRKLEEPFEAGDDLDIGPLMDALMWHDIVLRNQVLGLAKEEEER